jgi:hypothetical protein
VGGESTGRAPFRSHSFRQFPLQSCNLQHFLRERNRLTATVLGL